MKTTPSDLRALISYDPNTGALTWKERGPEWFNGDRAMTPDQRSRAWNKRFAGKPAMASQKGGGRLTGPLFGKLQLAHRVAWAIYHGEWPDGEIDHINGNPSDNRLVNLRVVDRTENCRNMPRRRDNASGVTGVIAVRGAWWARIGKKHLGVFMARDEAIAARKAAEQELGYHGNHGRAAQ